jgi:hypothetical protein
LELFGVKTLTSSSSESARSSSTSISVRGGRTLFLLLLFLLSFLFLVCPIIARSIAIVSFISSLLESSSLTRKVSVSSVSCKNFPLLTSRRRFGLSSLGFGSTREMWYATVVGSHITTSTSSDVVRRKCIPQKRRGGLVILDLIDDVNIDAFMPCTSDRQISNNNKK